MVLECSFPSAVESSAAEYAGPAAPAGGSPALDEFDEFDEFDMFYSFGEIMQAALIEINACSMLVPGGQLGKLNVGVREGESTQAN